MGFRGLGVLGVLGVYGYWGFFGFLGFVGFWWVFWGLGLWVSGFAVVVPSGECLFRLFFDAAEGLVASGWEATEPGRL